ncbi:MAG: Asp-tRNA(Asn)/Glu-tRNA(Gln) amidotransferase subunit GatC [Planctomycetes bacterium]|nr:Asp-tRNA(Asn)/Glu-tRNA(Gln) amidotransferase subunit GatC [Planctomycetota bacterium]
MQLDREKVRAVARLARLRVDDDEEALFSLQLTRFLDFTAELRELDTSAVQPFVHATEAANVFGADLPGQPLGSERALSGAPDRDGDKFRVPRVIEGS